MKGSVEKVFFNSPFIHSYMVIGSCRSMTLFYSVIRILAFLNRFMQFTTLFS
jgi:hypothetical protein